MTEHTFADYDIDMSRCGSGENCKTHCPKCHPTRRNKADKSLSVNQVEGVWLCHHCQWTGSLGKRSSGYGEARRNYTAPVPPAPESAVTSDDAALKWFARRGIPDWVLEDAGITAGVEFSPIQGKQVRALRFPYYRDGELVNIKYRSMPKDFWMSKGAELIFYGLDGIKDQKEICIVEGEIDKLTIDAVQGPATISVPNGGSKQGELPYLASAEDALARADRVLIGTDMDEVGNALAEELARRIGYAKCLRIHWPEKDANDTLVKHGTHGVCEAIADAQPYPVAGLVTVRELSARIDALYERGLDRGHEVGWLKFDQHYRPQPGLLTVVTGSPGSGKSHALDNIMVRLAERHGWTFGVCSPENQPLERHAAGLMSVYLDLPFADGPRPRMTEKERDVAKRWLAQHVTFVLPESPSLDRVLELADLLVYRNGIQGLVIDPWNQLDHTRPPGMTETEFVSESLTKIRQFAREKQVAVWLVAHPTKLRKDEHTGMYPVATPYDISGSAHFYNKTDNALSVWRHAADPSIPTQIHVQKIRFREQGKEGAVEFTYDPATGRLREV
jgi:twinkle protein